MSTTTRLTLDCSAYGDGFGTVEQHVARAIELEHPFIAVTEHGNVSSHAPLEKAANDAGIKSVFGLEAYCAPGDMRETGNQRKWHQTILAMDQEGYINLNRMVTRSWAEDFYRWPTVLGDNLAENQAGLIVLSGCSDSLLSCTLLGGKGVDPHPPDMAAAMKVASRYKALLGDRYYLEVQQFPELERTRILNPAFAEIGARLGIPLVATADVHYPMPDDNEMQIILHAASRGSKGFATTEAEWEYNIRLSPPVSDAVVLKRLMATGLTRSQSAAAILSSEEIGQRCNVTLPKVGMLRYPTAAGQSTKQLIWEWIADGWKYRMKRSPYLRAHAAEARARIKYEMDLIEVKDYMDYFLMLSDMIRWAKDSGIPVGPARGSAAASIVCWLLRITEINPLLFPVMLFERFIDINRTDMPDVDLDFADDRRDEVRLHAIEIYGADHVANIGTFTKYKGKNSLDDAGRVFHVPAWKLKVIKDLIVERSGGDSRLDNSLEDTVEMFPKAKAVMEEYPKLYNAYRLEGNMKGMSVHAAGLVIAQDPINDCVATYTRESMGRTLSVLAVDKYNAEYLNLMKADFLSLKTMGMIRVALDIIGMDLDDMYNVDLNDRKVIQAFKDDDVVGIFQFWGGTTRIVNHDVSPDTFLELCDIDALARPGPLHSGSTADYISVKRGLMKPVRLHPIMDRLTAQTKGQIIYQEQILSLVREVGDFSWTRAQEIRKIISLKKGEAAFNVREDLFHEGSARLHNMPHETSVQIWRRLVTAGQYAFNAAHCRPGETTMYRVGNGTEPTTMAELYNAATKFTDGVGGPGLGRDKYAPVECEACGKPEVHAGNQCGRCYHMRRMLRLGKFKVLSVGADGKVRPNVVRDVFMLGTQVMAEITLSNGRLVHATGDHAWMAEDGSWVTTNELHVGSTILGAQGAGPNKWHYRYGPNAEWMKKQSGKRCHVCGSTYNVDVSHEDRDETNDALENLEYRCRSCHVGHEPRTPWSRGIPTIPITVTAIHRNSRIDPVYTLEMDGSVGHNYVTGDGMINRNCVSYSTLAYWCMWLKVHYPVAFYTACLQKYNQTDNDDQFFLLRDAIKHGIATLPPDVDRSEATWSCIKADRAHVDGKDIRAGFEQIRGIGPTMGPKIINDRKENGLYGDWESLIRVPGIGPKTMESIRDAGESDDPFGIYAIDKKISTVRAMLMAGELGPLPKPTHRADEIPTDAVNFRCVWLGIPRVRNPQDVVEDERARGGEELDVIRARMKRPDLVKKMTVECIDDSDRTVFLRWSRFRFPEFEKALWDMKLGKDMVLVRGVKRGGFGTSVHVEHMWVISDDDEE